MTRNYPTTCLCGHEEGDHRHGYGECLAEEGGLPCLCAAYEPEAELCVDPFLDDSEPDEEENMPWPERNE